MRKIILPLLAASCVASFNLPQGQAVAQDRIKRVVEDIPAATTDNLYRVSADRTPSGFNVPRFVSLKFSRQYQRRGLPVMIVAETEMWRKVRDITGDEAWVRKPALSGSRTALTLQTASIRSRPNGSAREIARTDPKTLLRLQTCRDGWCEVKSDTGVKGWTRQDMLWGAKRP